MDKESSLNCTRVTLIVANLLSLLVGVSGFILGFARPTALNFVSISGLQVSMASLCLIGSASLGLLAAITLNYHLLLSYAGLIIGSFLMRILWSITAYIHSTVFILDCSASATILSTIATFFLALFALLLANARRNQQEDATSKAKLISNLHNHSAISISPVSGQPQQNSILKGSHLSGAQDKKIVNGATIVKAAKGQTKNQKNILSSVNCIQASPSPISNQSSLTGPSSQQGTPMAAEISRDHQHHHYSNSSQQTRPMTVQVTQTNRRQHQQQPPNRATRSSPNNQVGSQQTNNASNRRQQPPRPQQQRHHDKNANLIV